MPPYKRSRKKVARSLTFESDSEKESDTNSDKIKQRKRRRCKRTRELTSPCEREEFSNNVSLSDYTFESEGFVKNMCAELKNVLNEKKKYFQQYIIGAKKAYESEVQNLCQLYVDDNEISSVRDNLIRLREECMLNLDYFHPQENETLSAINNLLYNVKEKKNLLQDVLKRMQQIHDNFIKDMENREKNCHKQYPSIENDFKNNLNGIQRRVIHEMQKKAMQSMKENLKGLYLAHLKEIDE